MDIQKQLEYAWLAGFFDGEGCVYLKRDKPRGGSNRHNTYHLRLILSNTHLPTMHRVKEILDGEGIIGKVFSVDNPKHRTRWEWRVNATKAERVLRLMLPYLVTKKEQAEIALLSRQYQQKVGAMIPNPNGEQFEKIKQQLSDLKRVEYKDLQ